jgi:hypothetical protein
VAFNPWILGTPIGIGVGATVGSSKRNDPIHSNPNYHDENAKLLREYVIENNPDLEYE